MDKELENFLYYLQDKVQDCYKEETELAIRRFLNNYSLKEEKCNEDN